MKFKQFHLLYKDAIRDYRLETICWKSFELIHKSWCFHEKTEYFKATLAKIYTESMNLILLIAFEDRIFSNVLLNVSCIRTVKNLIITIEMWIPCWKKAVNCAETSIKHHHSNFILTLFFGSFRMKMGSSNNMWRKIFKSIHCLK